MGRPMEEIVFARETEVVLIPDGFPQLLPESTRGWITQVLGGNYTVQLETGRLVRVASADADAIGQELVAVASVDPNAPLTEDMVWSALRTIYDPEIPLNVVELGLIYGVDIRRDPGVAAQVNVSMTLTAPGCGMGQVLADDVDTKVRALPGVGQVAVELTFDPPWTPDRLSEEAKLELGMFY